MGWNDHVDFIETECLDCGQVNTWEFWDETALRRYTEDIAKMVGVNPENHGKCPRCGSTQGHQEET